MIVSTTRGTFDGGATADKNKKRNRLYAFSMSRRFCTNHKSTDPTSTQMHRAATPKRAPRPPDFPTHNRAASVSRLLQRRSVKTTDTFYTFYLNCFRLDCFMLLPIGSMFPFWMLFPWMLQVSTRPKSVTWVPIEYIISLRFPSFFCTPAAYNKQIVFGKVNVIDFCTS